jgi:iron(III) transport system substrate-binding protein
MPALSELKLVKYDEEGWTAKRGETMDRIKETIQKTR